jgi:hypothetical protein
MAGSESSLNPDYLSGHSLLPRAALCAEHCAHFLIQASPCHAVFVTFSQCRNKLTMDRCSSMSKVTLLRM